ncbi:MAG: exodeoxyribonuclease VII large subunit, partial [Oscillospiraceae bacterium]
MTLKDENGTLRAVMFKFDAKNLKFRPESGMKVIAKGRITVFPRDGQYQLYIADMIPDGVGELAVAYEQLKKKLHGEGLFDPAHKRELPKYPRVIALVTSPTGAAVQDMLRILRARYPIAKILIYPVLVQGPGAAPSIAEAIETLCNSHACELIITGRGGGSLEDLWCFNDEAVARAIYNADIPIISAVGHEPDVTIADYVADLRAATPSNAAELAVPDIAHIYSLLNDANTRVLQATNNKLCTYREYLKKTAEKPVLKSPLAYFAERRMVLDGTSERLLNIFTRKIAVSRESFVRLAAKLDAMSPLKVITRGYSIATDESGRIIKSVHDTTCGAQLNIKLEDG